MPSHDTTHTSTVAPSAWHFYPAALKSQFWYSLRHPKAAAAAGESQVRACGSDIPVMLAGFNHLAIGRTFKSINVFGELWRWCEVADLNRRERQTVADASFYGFLCTLSCGFDPPPRSNTNVLSVLVIVLAAHLSHHVDLLPDSRRSQASPTLFGCDLPAKYRPWPIGLTSQEKHKPGDKLCIQTHSQIHFFRYRYTCVQPNTESLPCKNIAAPG